MGVPDRYLIHDVTLVEPVVGTDAYGNESRDYGAAATRTEVRGWLQQDQRAEGHPDGRTPLEQRWLLVTNHPTISAKARVEWSGHPAGAVVFEVEGTPGPAYAPGGLHHVESTLRIVDG